MSSSKEMADPDRLRLPEWNKGIVAGELLVGGLVPRKYPVEKRVLALGSLIQAPSDVPPPIALGTLAGTRKAIDEVFQRILQRFGSYFDVANFESSMPQALSLDRKRQLYTYQPVGSDKYPPHLHLIPPQDQVPLLQIFDAMRLLDTGTILGRVIPQSFVPEPVVDLEHGRPDDGDTFRQLEDRNRGLRAAKVDIFTEPNIGDLDDWFSDAVFAQQQFTGTNPMTLELAADWIAKFARAAETQGNTKMAQLITSTVADCLYVQDNSYFRSAVGAPPDAIIRSFADDSKDIRYGCAPVTLFLLTPTGQLHPLAIVIDFKVSMEQSVVIFNQRLSPTDSVATERTDWAWRYAKTCAQSSDWARHELTVHLVNTHLVEEAAIVATQRSFTADHIVYRLLEPHWLKTLSLNAAARATLVPEVVVKIAGLNEDQVYTFIRDAYARFDWVENYVPKDLTRRGFPLDQLNTPKFHNYAYARNIILMWQTLRTFVSTMLGTVYGTDHQVASDPSVAAWCAEMRSPTGAQIPSFPEIKTREQLIDACTMCIHLASPQHTAINYTQEYYQVFVVNKPPAFYSPLPTSLTALGTFTEKDVINSLPVNRPRAWLLASHLPHILSMKVAENQNLVHYAVSLARMSKLKEETAIEGAALRLYADLQKLKDVFKNHSEEMDDKRTEYSVMDPVLTAVSILI